MKPIAHPAAAHATGVDEKCRNEASAAPARRPRTALGKMQGRTHVRTAPAPRTGYCAARCAGSKPFRRVPRRRQLSRPPKAHDRSHLRVPRTGRAYDRCNAKTREGSQCCPLPFPLARSLGAVPRHAAHMRKRSHHGLLPLPLIWRPGTARPCAPNMRERSHCCLVPCCMAKMQGRSHLSAPRMGHPCHVASPSHVLPFFLTNLEVHCDI
jgi:hypothetical protein